MHLVTSESKFQIRSPDFSTGIWAISSAWGCQTGPVLTNVIQQVNCERGWLQGRHSTGISGKTADPGEGCVIQRWKHWLQSQLLFLALMLRWQGVGKSFNLATSGFPHLQNGSDTICPASPQAIVKKVNVHPASEKFSCATQLCEMISIPPTGRYLSPLNMI